MFSCVQARYTERMRNGLIIQIGSFEAIKYAAQ